MAHRVDLFKYHSSLGEWGLPFLFGDSVSHSNWIRRVSPDTPNLSTWNGEADTARGVIAWNFVTDIQQENRLC